MNEDVQNLVCELENGSRKASWDLCEYVREHGDEDHAWLVPALTKGLLDLELRDGCAFSLECLGPAAKSAIPELILCLKHDPDNYVISPFARALGAMGSSAAPAIPSIIEMLQVVEDTQDTPELIDALVKIGVNSSEVLRAIEKVAADGFTEKIRLAGLKAIAELGG